MSHKGVIAETKPRTCTECGEPKETRPYGKDRAEVCFQCAMRTPESQTRAERAFSALVLDQEVH